MSSESSQSTKITLLALLLGAVLGELLFSFPEYAGVLPVMRLLGNTLFLGLLKVAVIPLIALCIFYSIAKLDTGTSLKRLGSFAVAFYFSTMILAVLLGVFLVSIVRPGSYLSEQVSTSDLALDAKVSEQAASGISGLIQNILSLAIPNNAFGALVEGNTLSIIVVSILFALGYRASSSSSRLVEAAKEGLDTIMYLLSKLLVFTPVAVFCLIADAVASTGIAAFGEAIGVYFLVVVVGLYLHSVVTLNLALRVFCGEGILSFAAKIKESLLTAFSTASSSATLPVTLKQVVENAKVPQPVANLVLPLGSTINMDGTALYEAVAVVFLAQVFGIDLSFYQLMIVAFTATVAAVGAAGIPSAGLVTMVVVVDTVNSTLSGPQIPIESVGLILGVDRILDMFRTSVNVLGDAVGAKVVASL